MPAGHAHTGEHGDVISPVFIHLHSDWLFIKCIMGVVVLSNSSFVLQALNKMEAQQHENNILQRVAVETENDLSPTSDTDRNTDDEEEDEELVKMEDMGSPSPTMHQGSLCCPGGQQDGPEEVGPMSEEDFGTCSPESLLQEAVEKLKTAMETHRWRERQTGESHIIIIKIIIVLFARRKHKT